MDDRRSSFIQVIAIEEHIPLICIPFIKTYKAACCAMACSFGGVTKVVASAAAATCTGCFVWIRIARCTNCDLNPYDFISLFCGVRENVIPDISQHSFEKRLIFRIQIVWVVTSTVKKRMIAWYAIIIEPRGGLMATRYHRHEIDSS